MIDVLDCDSWYKTAATMALPHSQLPDLIAAIGDNPVSAISIDLLLRGLGDAYVVGPPAAFRAAVIQSRLDPSEPSGFGTDAGALWSLLVTMRGWSCVTVEEACARELGRLIESELRTTVRFYGDVYFALTSPVARCENTAVRRLTLEDVALVQNAPEPLHGGCWATVEDMLEHGVAAGAIIDGQLIAIAFSGGRIARHTDISVNTTRPWQGRGFATAAASLVARHLQQIGQTPVWSTGEDNLASQRVAQKLGFTQAARRTYVIPVASP